MLTCSERCGEDWCLPEEVVLDEAYCNQSDDRRSFLGVDDAREDLGGRGADCTEKEEGGDYTLTGVLELEDQCNCVEARVMDPRAAAHVPGV